MEHKNNMIDDNPHKKRKTTYLDTLQEMIQSHTKRMQLHTVALAIVTVGNHTVGLHLLNAIQTKQSHNE